MTEQTSHIYNQPEGDAINNALEREIERLKKKKRKFGIAIIVSVCVVVVALIITVLNEEEIEEFAKNGVKGVHTVAESVVHGMDILVNGEENSILGEWQATAKDGTVVTYKFTDEFENQSTKETIYYLTIKTPDGSVEKDKGTYNISTGTVIGFRSITNSKTNSTYVEFEITKDVMKFKYSAGLGCDEAGIEFKKIAD